MTACDAACSTSSLYDFCSMGRDLKAKGVKLHDVTCNYLSKKQTIYGVSACPSISCSNLKIVEAVAADELVNFCEEDEQIIQALIEDTLISYECVM